MAGNSSQQQTASNLDVPVVPASQDEAVSDFDVAMGIVMQWT